MIEKELDGQRWLEFEQLQAFPEIRHGILLKSQNFDNRHIFAPQQKAAEKLLNLKILALGNQVHKDRIVAIDDQPSSFSFISRCDGLMTCQRQIGLLVRHADCQAVIFYDPIQHAIANVHSGWRGSVQGMLPKAVKQMEQSYGCKPENLRVCISPSLGPQAAEFRHFKDELPQEFYPFQVKPTYFDFWEISRHQLINAGVLDEQIEIAKLCTYSDQKRFYSYRQDKQCGYHLTCVSLEAKSRGNA